MKEEIREQWNKLQMRGYNIPEGESFGVCSDNTIWNSSDIADWWLDKLEKAIQSERDRIVDLLEKTIQDERYSGAPYALNKAINLINNK